MEQGWISSDSPDDLFSEAVIVHFDPSIISIRDLVAIHLNTHQSTNNHSMRSKYRSAVYYFKEVQKQLVQDILREQQPDFDEIIITKVLPFSAFRCSPAQYQNYYQQEPDKPFCKRYISPKLNLLLKKYSSLIDNSRISKIR